MKATDRQAAFENYRAMLEEALSSALPLPAEAWPRSGMPRSMVEAMRYGVLDGGKRLRGVLLLAAHEACGGHPEQVQEFAAAVEMIHAYSLIHDDLPAMDNDDIRRGKPSCHKAFGEATAILAGDALLNLAYEQMAASRHPRAMEALHIISRRAGASGMIAGQSADLAMEGQPADVVMLEYIHRHKTADLIIAPVLAGMALAGADEAVQGAGEAYALHLGLAFQIVDDVLDIEGDPALLGKSVLKDVADGKLTWPAVHGMEASKAAARQHIAEAVKSLDILGDSAQFLRDLVLNTLQRVR